MTKFLARRALVAIAGGAVLLTATVAAAPSQAATDGAPSKALSVSDKSDRSKPRGLGGQTLAGTKWIFVQNDSNVSKVLFFVDQPDLANITHTENAKPFDLNGTKDDGSAQGLDTKTLKDGQHTVTAVVLSQGQKLDVLRSTFTVKNAKLAPAAAPKQEAAPAAPAAAPKQEAKKPAAPAKQAPAKQGLGAAPEANEGLSAAPEAREGISAAPEAQQGLSAAPDPATGIAEANAAQAIAGIIAKQ